MPLTEHPPHIPFEQCITAQKQQHVLNIIRIGTQVILEHVITNQKHVQSTRAAVRLKQRLHKLRILPRGMLFSALAICTFFSACNMP